MNEIFPARYAAVVAVSNRTRAQVVADMKEAKRTGNIAAPTLTSMDYAGYGTAKMNEIFPSRYPAQAEVAGKTRAEVRTELAEAQRTGDMQADTTLSLLYTGIPGQKLKDLYPTKYPVKNRTAQAHQVVASAY